MDHQKKPDFTYPIIDMEAHITRIGMLGQMQTLEHHNIKIIGNGMRKISRFIGGIIAIGKWLLLPAIGLTLGCWKNITQIDKNPGN